MGWIRVSSIKVVRKAEVVVELPRARTWRTDRESSLTDLSGMNFGYWLRVSRPVLDKQGARKDFGGFKGSIQCT
jgi:hypothetical protein